MIVREGRKTDIVGAVMFFFFFFYLELILQFLFNPLGHMTERHLPLPQFGTHMQIQLGGHTEAVPTEEITP